MIKSMFKLSESCCNNFRHDACHDKENLPQRLENSPLKHDSDISVYSSSSRARPACHGSSPSHCSHQRRTLEDYDAQSQDSDNGSGCPKDENKFYRFVEEDGEEDFQLPAVPEFIKPTLRRSVSATEESISYALQRSSTAPDLIGDFSTAFCLPLTTGRHQDLKSITPTTLVLLMRGDFSDAVASYKVIDCRYPYEFDGGHISDAINWYTKEQILENLLNTNVAPPSTSDPRKRNILVFHCEFSIERGPNLYRFLRNLDRIRIKDVYPTLHYPEIYLLEGWYKSFYEQYSEMCAPESYKPMLHSAHSSDLRHFRAKSKTWNADRSRHSSRGNFKRLRF